MRPKKLSDDKTLFDVYRFVVNQYKKKGFLFDEIWTIMPCAPNLKTEDLKKYQLFTENKELKPILSVSEYKVPIEWAFNMERSGKLVSIMKISINKISRY